MIYLVTVNPDGSETHIEWSGHSILDDAKKEFSEMRTLSFNSDIKPQDGYVYEADEPQHGNIAVKLDVAHFTNQAFDWAEKQVVGRN